MRVSRTLFPVMSFLLVNKDGFSRRSLNCGFRGRGVDYVGLAEARGGAEDLRI